MPLAPSRSHLDCLRPTLFPFCQLSGRLEFPIGIRVCHLQTFSSCSKSLFSFVLSACNKFPPTMMSFLLASAQIVAHQPLIRLPPTLQKNCIYLSCSFRFSCSPENKLLDREEGPISGLPLRKPTVWTWEICYAWPACPLAGLSAHTAWNQTQHHAIECYEEEMESNGEFRKNASGYQHCLFSDWM